MMATQQKPKRATVKPWTAFLDMDVDEIVAELECSPQVAEMIRSRKIISGKRISEISGRQTQTIRKLRMHRQAVIARALDNGLTEDQANELADADPGALCATATEPVGRSNPYHEGAIVYWLVRTLRMNKITGEPVKNSYGRVREDG